MFNELGYNKNLEILVKAKKADESIAKYVKSNLDKKVLAEKNVRKVRMQISRLNTKNENKINEKNQTSIFNVKGYIGLSFEIKSIKKQIKLKREEIEEYKRELGEARETNKQIEDEINNQFKIYQENELYAKAIEQIDKKKIDLSSEFYVDYLKHKDKYSNSIYSIENKSKLPEPDAEALITVLNVLKNCEESTDANNNMKSKKKSATAKKNSKSTGSNK